MKKSMRRAAALLLGLLVLSCTTAQASFFTQVLETEPAQEAEALQEPQEAGAVQEAETPQESEALQNTEASQESKAVQESQEAGKPGGGLAEKLAELNAPEKTAEPDGEGKDPEETGEKEAFDETGKAESSEEPEQEKDSRISGDLAEFVPLESLQVITSEQAAEINAQMSVYIPADGSLIHNMSTSYYYYDHLDPVAREMYDIMLGIAKDPVEENHGVMMTDLDPRSDEFAYYFVMAYYSMIFDHPELFWLYNSIETTIGTRSECLSAGGIYVIYFGLVEPYDNYRDQMTAFNKKAEEILEQVDRSASDYEIAKQIHDILMQLVTYDTDVLNRHESQDFAHTAYGALVKNSSGVSNYAVCDGYSLAYEYLLQQCGIEAAVVNGDAGNSPEEAGGHAWNLIRIDGEWYEADCTWDDPDSDFEDLLSMVEQEEIRDWLQSVLDDEEFMDRVQHYLFLISTEEMTHFVPGDRYNVDFFGEPFPFLDECYHFRYQTNGKRSRIRDTTL